MNREINYRLEPELSAREFIDLLERSTLAARRPVEQPDRIERMLRQASIIITARVAPGFGGRLIGVSRAITDFTYCTYLSDLAVDEAFQRQGIGVELIRRTRAAAGDDVNLILLAAPAARGYYPKIGMTAHDSCWMLRPGDPL
jgi:GNAT superfamily N-acetyltransferase